MRIQRIKTILEKINTKNGRILIIIGAIICVGIFFRTYNFNKWLHFEIDQTYDALMISPALEQGISNLPLLGPTAGGGRALRLGPAFYYMEYLGARIFGNTPPGHAALVLIFSILAIPLFYLFSRRYFSRHVSIGLLALFATSFYIIIYSRFSWSPNVLPFLTMLSFYALLRSVSKNEPMKEKWFLVAITAVAITTQIHFNAFFVVPAVVIIFLLIKRPRFRWHTWIFALFIFIAVYSPMIANEVITKGENIKFFVTKISKSNNILGPKKSISFDVRYNVFEYFLILTGEDLANNNCDIYVESKSECDSYKRNIPLTILACILFAVGLLFLVKNIWQEKDTDKKNFLWIILLWFLASLYLFFSLLQGGFRIRPRFFLLVSPVTFMFFGFILQSFKAQKNKFRLALFFSAIFILIGINTYKIFAHFNELKKTSYNPESIETEDVFPNTNRSTLQQQLAIVDYIQSKYTQNGYPIYIKGNRDEFTTTFWYHLSQLGIQYYGKPSKSIVLQGNYFIINETTSDSKKYNSISDSYSMVEKKDFGSLVLYYYTPKTELIDPLQKNQLGISDQQAKISEQYTWKKFFTK